MIIMMITITVLIRLYLKRKLTKQCFNLPEGHQ